jgi:hypothetical protein
MITMKIQKKIDIIYLIVFVTLPSAPHYTQVITVQVPAFQLLCKDHMTRPNVFALSVRPLTGSHRPSPSTDCKLIKDTHFRINSCLFYTSHEEESEICKVEVRFPV